MRVECPQLTKCCFCLPLRYGLLVWGCIKLILAVVFGIAVVIMMMRADMWMRRDWLSCLVSISLLLAAITDAAFQIVFIIGALKKDRKLLLVYYRAKIIGLTAYLFFMLLLFGYHTHAILHADWRVIAIIFGDLVLQVYLIFLVRSEIVKMRGLNHVRLLKDQTENITNDFCPQKV